MDSAQAQETTPTQNMEEQASTEQPAPGSQVRLQEVTVTEAANHRASFGNNSARDYELRPHTTTQEILTTFPASSSPNIKAAEKRPSISCVGLTPTTA